MIIGTVPLLPVEARSPPLPGVLLDDGAGVPGAAGSEEPEDGVPLSVGGVTEADGVASTGGVVVGVSLGVGVVVGGFPVSGRQPVKGKW